MEDLQRGDARRFLKRLLLALLILCSLAQSQVVHAHSAQGFTEDLDRDE